MKGRIVAHRRLCCPVRDAGFTLRRNTNVSESPWWVHYTHGGVPIPSDQPHQELVNAVNELKLQEGQGEGGKFSINEHGQVVARMSAAPGLGNSIQVIGIVDGKVYAYRKCVITFDRGRLDPAVTPPEGAPWTGPKCGISYTFHAPHTRKPPSRLVDAIEVRLEDTIFHLSIEAGIILQLVDRSPVFLLH